MSNQNNYHQNKEVRSKVFKNQINYRNNIVKLKVKYKLLKIKKVKKVQKN